MPEGQNQVTGVNARPPVHFGRYLEHFHSSLLAYLQRTNRTNPNRAASLQPGKIYTVVVSFYGRGNVRTHTANAGNIQRKFRWSFSAMTYPGCFPCLAFKVLKERLSREP